MRLVAIFLISLINVSALGMGFQALKEEPEDFMDEGGLNQAIQKVAIHVEDSFKDKSFRPKKSPRADKESKKPMTKTHSDADVTASAKRAISILKKAAKRGQVDSMVELADEYFKSESHESQKLAVSWLEKAAARDHVDSQFHLAKIYLDEEGICPSKEKAIFWLKRAGRNRHAEAAYRLGIGYLNEDIEFSASDTMDAVDWLSFAAQLDHAQARHELAIIYYDGEIVNGEEVAQDRDLAIALFIGAANQGIADAMFNLGVHFEDLDWDKSKFWYEKAVAEDHMEAKFNLGRILIKTDVKRGLKLIEEAAVAGDGAAEAFLLARSYRAKDQQKAKKLLEEAAKQGRSWAPCESKHAEKPKNKKQNN
jgi:TPR repeat protein